MTPPGTKLKPSCLSPSEEFVLSDPSLIPTREDTKQRRTHTRDRSLSELHENDCRLASDRRVYTRLTTRLQRKREEQTTSVDPIIKAHVWVTIAVEYVATQRLSNDEHRRI